MKHEADQFDLDFDGSDPVIQERMRWMENRRKEREFWTKERLCLSWMQGTTPDDSDMRWWASQPQYRQRYYLDLFDRATEEARWHRRPKTAFHIFAAMVEEQGRIIEAQDESLTLRFLEWIREDFKAGRGCSIDLTNCSPGQRHRSQACLDEAIRRAGIPLASLGLAEPSMA